MSHETPTARRGRALITGASSGIGAVYAERLARRGYDLVLVARRADLLSDLAGRLAAETGADSEILVADLTDVAALRTVEDRLAAGDIEVFVNNAGAAVLGAMADAEAEALHKLVLLNVVAPTQLARAVLPSMRARGAGAIINIGSVTGLMTDRAGVGAVYSAGKAYVLALSEGLNAELAGEGVFVQAVLPGVTRTAIWGEGDRSRLSAMPAEMIMSAEDMVDAALAAWDQGEAITIPALPDNRDLEAFLAARRALYPNLSRSKPAARYGIG